MTRTIIEGNKLEVSKPISEKITDVKAWLEDKAKEPIFVGSKDVFLLAHADDGVIWGKIADNELKVPTQGPSLRVITLQTARLFSEKAEIYLWRDSEDENTFLVRTIIDDNQPFFHFDEEQILWGTHAEKAENDKFTLMSDGSQGLRHYVPLPTDKVEDALKNSKRPLRLRVRNYLEDDNGFVRVAYSRLVTLTAK